jgi:hypothetical protein
MLIDAINAPFQDREISLNTVGIDVAANVFFLAVNKV